MYGSIDAMPKKAKHTAFHPTNYILINILFHQKKKAHKRQHSFHFANTLFATQLMPGNLLRDCRKHMWKKGLSRNPINVLYNL